ncbi:MAG: DUF362 domain-containing protein [bacterium]|nr:DUF362 domain-containing protein [bacterium]
MKDEDKKNNNDIECGCGINRRDFLKTVGMAAAAVAVPEIVDAKPKILPEVKPLKGSISVGIVKKKNIDAMVRRAVELAGGLDEIKQGDTVLLKPNLVSRSGSGSTRITTNPLVVQAVIRLVKERTPAKNITVADARSFNMSTTAVAKEFGLYEIIKKEGVNFSPWEKGNYVSVTHKKFKYLDFHLLVPEKLFAFQHFINIPLLKNHDVFSGSDVEYTCCIKNHVGILHPFNRFQDGAGIHTADLGKICAELNLVVPVHTMNVIDALTIVLTGGPVSPGITANPGLIMASKDRVAGDSLAVAVLKYYAGQNRVNRPYVKKKVWEQAQLMRAIELGLGRSRDKIKIRSDGVDIIRDITALWQE